MVFSSPRTFGAVRSSEYFFWEMLYFFEKMEYV